jgi:hypothetical protein
LNLNILLNFSVEHLFKSLRPPMSMKQLGKNETRFMPPDSVFVRLTVFRVVKPKNADHQNLLCYAEAALPNILFFLSCFGSVIS